MITLHFLITAFVVVLAPGTGVIYTLALGLGQGWRASAWAAVGCTFGIVPHLAAATLGLAAVLHSSALLFQIVKAAGVAYLLFLAWQALRSGGALAIRSDHSSLPGWKIAWRGALINILNPKLSVFFLALLPPFLSGAPASAAGNVGAGPGVHGDDLRCLRALRSVRCPGPHLSSEQRAGAEVDEPRLCRRVCRPRCPAGAGTRLSRPVQERGAA